jgi:IS4 transposase
MLGCAWDKGKKAGVLTNKFGLPAATICALYKSRWQVEFFLQMDQSASADQTLLRTTENAVKTQIWIAVSV